jgi:hypothetical protein
MHVCYWTQAGAALSTAGAGRSGAALGTGEYLTSALVFLETAKIFADPANPAPDGGQEHGSRHRSGRNCPPYEDT